MALLAGPFYFPKGGLPKMPVFMVNGFWINISGLSYLLGGFWLVLCCIDGSASSPILLYKRGIAYDGSVCDEWFLNKHQHFALFA
jgi:hypothetical protein